ncbi:MFS transporter [Tychonema sp. LEGE 07199]|uniref:MFS transporter n=1 Tax=unclassified Tychonema TaxID=2642144 RepID=UPI00187E7CAF|nr:MULTISPECIES: MFS transporter [unclassified Tychonema]MBE9121490.1 MFS transporter [Tychonema sp. LEGE 07199]MBE9130343.1 MFS transporter [Tychonema sp. LEGE 07196]
MPKFKFQLSSWLPRLPTQVWILAAGRFLSQSGTGFTLFYAPIFFVDRVGLSATAVGIGLGIGSIAGIFGRVLGGSFCDSKFWGRRRTLLLATMIAAVASFVLAATNNFAGLVAGNILMGFGVGLYWPPTETMVADLTEGTQRQEAFALTRLADNLGLQVGIIFGGVLIAVTGNYRSLFIIDGISFIVLFAVVAIAISETYKPSTATDASPKNLKNGWMVALNDRTLLVYASVNILFTLYISQIQTTMPLYFSKFVQVGTSGTGFSTGTITVLFAFSTFLTVALQLPIVKALRGFSHPKALMISALLWGMGFIAIGLTGMAATGNLFLAVLGLSFLSLATVAYTPFASALVVDLAPESLRGVYLALNSQCWAIGYLIGPPLGGFALDRGKWGADNFWLGLAVSVILAIAILRKLDPMLKEKIIAKKQLL